MRVKKQLNNSLPSLITVALAGKINIPASSSPITKSIIHSSLQKKTVAFQSEALAIICTLAGGLFGGSEERGTELNMCFS